MFKKSYSFLYCESYLMEKTSWTYSSISWVPCRDCVVFLQQYYKKVLGIIRIQPYNLPNISKFPYM